MAPLDDDALLNGLFDFGDWLLEPCAGRSLAAEATGSGSSAAATAAFAAAWPEAAAPTSELSSPYGFGEDDSTLFAACAAAAAAAAAAHLGRSAVHVKLPQHAHVAAAAPSDAAAPNWHAEALAAALPRLPLPGALAHLFAPAADAAAAPPPLGALGATVRPGCTLVTLEAMVPPLPTKRGKKPAAPPSAAELLRRALATPGAAGEFLRSQEEVVVADCAGGEATWRRRDNGVTEQRDVALAPRAPPVHPLAVLCNLDAELSVAVEEVHGAVELRCRLAAGRVLPLLPLPASASGELRVLRCTLPRCDESGTALIEALPPGVPLHRAGAPRPVLLTSDAAIAAEVAASGDALRAMDAAGSGGGGAARAHVEQSVLALGAALTAGATPAAVAAGAAAALWMGWAAAFAALLRTPAFAEGACGGHARLLSLLCHASASPRPAMMRLLLASSPTLRRGGALAAALAAEARAAGHCHAPFAAAAALDALAARQGAAADATPEAAEAAGKLLRAAAAELDAAQAKADAEAESDADADAGADACGDNIEPAAIMPPRQPLPLDADVHAFRSTALLILLQYTFCAFMRRRYPPVPAQAVLAAMPCPEWRIWLRMPTAMCCNGASGPVVAAREAVLAAILLLAFAPGVFARLRARHVAVLHVATMAYFMLLEPVLCALATHALFGVAIRQPWQGGMKQAMLTLLTHLSAEQRLPRGTHAATLVLRGALPLAVRAAQAAGPLAPPPTRVLAQLRLLPAHAGWDVLHAALTLACVAHAAAAHRRRSRGAAKGKME